MSPKALKANTCTSFILLFLYAYISNYLLSTYYAPSAILDSGDIGVSETDRALVPPDVVGGSRN